MKIIVTGGAGFIGSNLVNELLRRNHFVRVIDNLSTGYIFNINPSADFYQVDIRDIKKLNEITSDFEVMIHLAANVGNVKSIENPIHDAEVNVIGTRNIIKSVIENKMPKLIYLSSAAIYGAPKYLPIDERHSCEPDSPYGVSKLAGEKDVLCMSRIYGFKALCLRPFNVYGKNQRFDAYGNVIPIFFHKIKNNEKLDVFGDGEQTRDFVNVKDVVKAIIVGLEKKIQGVFNIASGNSLTVNELIEYIKVATKCDIKVQYLPPRKGEVLHSSANIESLREYFGYNPQQDYIKLLIEYWEWYLKDPKINIDSL